MPRARFVFHLCLSVCICGSALCAAVRVNCYVEPNHRLKDARQLGCDFQNLAATPVVLSAADVRDASFGSLGSPLRWSAADYVVKRSEGRSFWGTFFTVAKWVGVALSFAQGLDFIKIEGNWEYVIPTTTGALQTVDAVGRRDRTPLTMPPDYVPEGDFVLDGFETRSYVLIAAEPVKLTSFRTELAGRPLATAGLIAPGAAAGARSAAFTPLEPFDRRLLAREALSLINEWVYEVRGDTVLVLEDFAAYPQPTTETDGGSRFAVRQVGISQGEPAKGVEVPTVAGAAFDSGDRLRDAPLPLSWIRTLQNVSRDRAAFEEWAALGSLTRGNMEAAGIW